MSLLIQPLPTLASLGAAASGVNNASDGAAALTNANGLEIAASGFAVSPTGTTDIGFRFPTNRDCLLYIDGSIAMAFWGSIGSYALYALGGDPAINLAQYRLLRGGVGCLTWTTTELQCELPLELKSHAKAALPSAARAGNMIYVTDEAGGAVPCFSDGTNWRRVTDRAVVT